MDSELYKRIGGSTPENNLAEDYAHVLDQFGSLAGAMEDGNLRYAWDKANSLAERLQAMLRRLQETDTDGQRTYTGADLDSAKVAVGVAAFSQYERIGRPVHRPEGFISAEAQSVAAAALANAMDQRRATDEFFAQGDRVTNPETS